MTNTPTGFSRRGLLKGAGLGAAAIGAVPLLNACGGLKGSSSSSSDVLKIGYVSPQTGALASFAAADNFIVSQVQDALRKGMTIGGKIPYTTTFANFSTGRVYDQIRQSVAYSGKNVKICASHAGLTLGEDGATHQILEDIGLMKMLPGMTVINPCDYNQTRAATIAIAEHEGPVYLRFGRPVVPVFTDADQKFEIGKAWMVNEGTDVSIFATGHLVWEAILAGEELEKQGINAEIINIHTIKPLDAEAVLKSVAKTGCVVTAEEHNRLGGLGDSIAQLLAVNNPTPQEYVAVNDSFGESGTPEQLMTKYGLDAEHIVLAAKKVLERKQNAVISI